ncbi:MAG: mannose-1-phosphate guanylyltransferase [Bacteroidetes bacterium]|nr:mannose-1-phosphate guanylyltransferase [Bacteroidota bacterium]
MELFAVIMAGGVGARFWPRSRQKEPKQLLSIFSEKSLIQNTVERLNGIIDPKNIFIVTNKIQKEGILQQLPSILEKNIIIEPFGKNTAACIGLASVIIESINKDAITIVLPADHLIHDEQKFRDTIIRATEFADKKEALVTIGINPSRPETGYGYIQCDGVEEGDDIFKVKTFAEKPNLETAERFIHSGDFLWNSGMFIWKASIIMKEINKFMPELHEGLVKISQSINSPDFENVLLREYGQLKSISIDYGIMEHSKKVFVIKGVFDWNDVGSWEAVYQLSEKDENYNVKDGDVYCGDTKGSYIHSKKKFTAVVGVENLIVIETDDALLICDREKAQSVKLVVDHLKLNKRNNLL